MGQIVETLIHGLNQKMVQARLNSVDAKGFLFGTHFPVKKVNGFKWEMLTNQREGKNVAADIMADNASTIRKKRPVFEIASGDIPLIGISREMTRKELKDYQTAAALASDPDAAKLVEYWGNDVDFCFNGVQSELEYIAWALVSNAGRLEFTMNNNATFANQFNLDYQVDVEQKMNNSTGWDKSSSADPIGDLRKAVERGKKLGVSLKYAFMSLDEFYRFVSCQQVIKSCASYLANAADMAQTPDLKAVNAMLKKQAWLNKLQIVVIDQDITRENQDGSQVTENPFASSRVVLSESLILGTTQYDVLKESAPMILSAVRSHTVIKKYGEIEPTKEVTIGQADALPSLDTAYRNVYLKTDGTAWS